MPANATASQHPALPATARSGELRSRAPARSPRQRQKAREAWTRGVALSKQGNHAGALRCFQRAAQDDPEDSLYWLNLSVCEHKTGAHGEALEHARRAFALDRSCEPAALHLGELLRLQLQMDELLAVLDQLEQTGERAARWHLLRGLALMHSHQWQHASESLLAAMAGSADDRDTRIKATQQLGHCFLSMREHAEAGICYRMLVDMGPLSIGSALYAAHASAWTADWAEMARDLARLQTAIEGIRRLPPDTPTEALSPFCLITLTDDPALMRWAAELARRQGPRAADGREEHRTALPRPNGKLRVGLLSNDFHHHATAMLLVEALECLDRTRFEIYLYASGKDDGSALRQRLVRAAAQVREVAALPNEAIAAEIREDRIALMIDLKGYTQGSRAQALASRPAPLQISWLGFPGTTGAPYLDYVIGDPVVTPLSHAAHFSEAIAQMPVCYQPNDRHRDQPEPASREACGLPAGAFVFASFNQHYKIVPGVFAAWCRILAQVPGSVLWLMAPVPAVQARLVEAARGHGIEPERLVFANFLKSEAHRARLPNADLFLDTFPCGGHTTTSDALWAGLPVLTLAGQGFASRVAASLLGGLGLHELVCTALDAYEQQAVNLARQPATLAGLRQRLIEARANSPVFDGRRFAADLGALLTRMAERHDAGLPPAPLAALGNPDASQAELARRIDAGQAASTLASALGLLQLDALDAPESPEATLSDRIVDPIDTGSSAVLEDPTPETVPLPSPSDPADDTVQSLHARVSQLEQQHAEALGAIDTLVTALLELREATATAPAPAPAPAADAAAAQRVADLTRRLQTLEQSAARERTLADLSAVSRAHAKQATMVFVGTTYFGCNVKYAWLAARERAAAEGIETWFLPFDARQEAQVRTLTAHCFPSAWEAWSAEDVQRALGAAVVVTSDHLLNPNPYAAALLAGARQVQLWHGISIKEIGLRNLVGLQHLDPRMARIMATCGPYASLVGTARAQLGEWQRWFSFDQYAALGYARNDVLHREPTAADLLNVDTDLLERMRTVRRSGHRVVFHAPTFRDGVGISWLLSAGLEQVAADIARRGDLLVLNVHPVEAPQVPSIAPALPSVAFVTPRSDVYPLLRESDVLVTDYSSVMFDYLHLDRPIVLYRPDHARYTGQSRQLFDAKLATLPGPCVSDPEALMAALRRRGADAHIESRRQLRAQLFDAVDGQAAERLWPHLRAQMDSAIASRQAACWPT